MTTKDKVDPRGVADTAAVAEPVEWWVLTGGFFRMSGSAPYVGPFATESGAFGARVELEHLRGTQDLWIDSRPAEGKR